MRGTKNYETEHYDMIVFSHLRWEFVIQRPQHIISLLSKGKKVLFVEEPIQYAKNNHLTAHIIKPTKNITVLQPRISCDNLISELEPLVNEYSHQLELKNP